MNETDTNYVVLMRLDGANLFAIWTSSPSKPDSLFTSNQQQLRDFSSRGDLDSFADDNEISIQPDDSPLYDFDAIKNWTAALRRTEIDCVSFLDAWNLLVDIEASLGSELEEPDGSRTVYEKLFWGNNLPAVTPEGEHYEPEWSEEEAKIMAKVFQSGIETLQNGIAIAA